ncbi:hypothetical protein ENBRE01_3053 [Enteropsectra breve]|nr:hypothetical protein ENBRE01_2798 [Enteropsectra breve]KAI5152842.1 hypothetical protein ENBRE01_3053 [Enteropsectra breve]
MPIHLETEKGRKASEYRFMSQKQCEIAKDLVERFEKEGFIEKNNNPDGWLNPIVLVQKSNQKWRMCLDLRKLNNITEQDNHPIPDIQYITDPLRDMKYFSKLDIKDGFFRIPLNNASRTKTTFKVGNEFYQFKVLPMGYRNAPNIFQRTMETILKEEIGKDCIVYIDDILIFSKDLETHWNKLEKIMIKLKEYGMDINWKKADIAKTEVDFLGYNIKNNTIRPNQSRVQGIIDYPSPNNLKSLRRFIGILAYDRRFLERISAVLRPLYALTGKDIKWEWTHECEKAFLEIKEKLANATDIIIPNSNEKYILETDASDTGVGAILKQKEGIVGYFSGSLSKEQKKYTITEKELLAIKWGIEKCKYYLYGRNFDVITDHKAIIYYKTKREFGNARIQRWYEELDKYDFNPRYRSGEEMIIPDALSRSEPHCMLDTGELNNTPKVCSTSLAQGLEKEIYEIHCKLNHRKAIINELRKHDILISTKQLNTILNKCKTCLERDNQIIHSSKYIDTYEPGELFGLDLMEYKNLYITVAVDYFTRRVFTQWITSKTKEKIQKFINKVYTILPFKKIITDRGREFYNHLFKEWVQQNNIEHILRPAHYHQGTGRVERVIRTLRNALNKTKGSVKINLNKITETYNNMIHRGIGMTPIQAMQQENQQQILEYVDKYKKEFIYKELPELKEGTKVLIKNEIRSSKDDKYFDKEGKIIKRVSENSYEVKLQDNSILVRHYSQLKVLPGDVVYT